MSSACIVNIARNRALALDHKALAAISFIVSDADRSVLEADFSLAHILVELVLRDRGGAHGIVVCGPAQGGAVFGRLQLYGAFRNGQGGSVTRGVGNVACNGGVLGHGEFLFGGADVMDLLLHRPCACRGVRPCRATARAGAATCKVVVVPGSAHETGTAQTSATVELALPGHRWRPPPAQRERGKAPKATQGELHLMEAPPPASAPAAPDTTRCR